ncbi:MAG: energy transducer TonB [Burkholderiales bacterium]|nr:energy transducer TonB [Burkholderiales bacterium]
MTLTSPSAPMPGLNRNFVIASSVVVFHVAALWALQNGLLRRAVEMVVPVALLSEIIEPPRPKVEPPAPKAPEPVKQPVVRRAEPATAPAPPPLPAAAPTPDPIPLAPEVAPAPIAPLPPNTAPVAMAPAPPAPPTPVRVELPSSDADYLQNPKPAYPAISKRLGEQGKVVVRVLIGTDGTAQKAEIQQSSGFDRLDQAARTTVLKWRYVPGKRGGVAQAMWFNVPIHFVLE